MAWLLRAAGFLLMWLGFGLTLNPLRVLADLLPFLGRVVGAVGRMLSFLLAAILSVVVIVISWLFVPRTTPVAMCQPRRRASKPPVP